MQKFIAIYQQKQLWTVLFIGMTVMITSGWIYQKATELSCFTKLFLTSFGACLFWLFMAIPIHRFLKKQPLPKSLSSSAVLHTGYAILFTIGSLICAYFTLQLGSAYLFHCNIPANWSDLLMTNHFIPNFALYWFIGFTVSHQKTNTAITKQPIANTSAHSIILREGSKLTPLAIPDLLWVQAANNCAILHTFKGKRVVYRSLKSLEEEFNHQGLIRIHRSALVNINQVTACQNLPSGDGEVVLINQQTIRYSRNYKKTLISRLPQLT